MEQRVLYLVHLLRMRVVEEVAGKMVTVVVLEMVAAALVGTVMRAVELQRVVVSEQTAWVAAAAVVADMVRVHKQLVERAAPAS